MKNDKNFIGTFSKDNVPILKNNESAIVNLADSFNKGTQIIAMKFINDKLFYFDSYGIPFIPDIIKKQYDRIITNIYRIQSIDSIECGNFVFYSLKQIFKINQIILNFYYNSIKIIFKKMIYNYI